MSIEKPRSIHRRDYRPPDYTIDRVDLDFILGEEESHDVKVLLMALVVELRVKFPRSQWPPGLTMTCAVATEVLS